MHQISLYHARDTLDRRGGKQFRFRGRESTLIGSIVVLAVSSPEMEGEEWKRRELHRTVTALCFAQPCSF